MRGALRRAGIAGAVVFALLVAAPAASAAPPNDNWANREVIPALPFTDVVTDVATATRRGHRPDRRLPRRAHQSGREHALVLVHDRSGDRVRDALHRDERLRHDGVGLRGRARLVPDDPRRLQRRRRRTGDLPVARHRRAAEAQHHVLDRGHATRPGHGARDAEPQRRAGGHLSGDQARRHRRRDVRRRLLRARGRQRRQRDAGRRADPGRHVHAERRRRQQHQRERRPRRHHRHGDLRRRRRPDRHRRRQRRPRHPWRPAQREPGERHAGRPDAARRAGHRRRRRPAGHGPRQLHRPRLGRHRLGDRERQRRRHAPDGAGPPGPDGRARQPGRARGRRHQRPRQLAARSSRCATRRSSPTRRSRRRRPAAAGCTRPR